MSRERSVRFVHQPPSNFWRYGRFILGLIFTCTLAFSGYKLAPEVLPLRTVNITGTFPHVDPNVLRETLQPFMQQGFLTVHTTALRTRLQQFPWIYAVDIKREWPDTLNIKLIEQQPIARFNDQALINAQGDLFTVDPATIPTTLPIFLGAPGQQTLLLQTYQKMTSIVTPLKLKITILNVDARQAWRLQLDNGIVLLLGKDDPLERLQRFVAAYPQLVNSQTPPISYIDLRYPHGMAVSFKQV